MAFKGLLLETLLWSLGLLMEVTALTGALGEDSSRSRGRAGSPGQRPHGSLLPNHSVELRLARAARAQLLGLPPTP